MTESFAPRSSPQSVSRGQVSERWIHRPDVTRRVDLVGSDYRFDGPAVGHDEPVLSGMFQMEQLRPGLVLHRTRVTDLADLRTSLTLQPGIKLAMVVAGYSDIELGSMSLRLGPDHPQGQAQAQLGSLVSLAEPERFTRYWRTGRSEAKVSVTLTPEWLDGSGLDDSHELDTLRRFQSQHLARCDWQPSQRALALAGQIVHAPPLQPFLHRLYLESRTVELVTEALATLCRAERLPAPGLSVRDRRRLQELKARIDDGSLQAPDMADVAQQIGMSVATLQRKFRLFAGMPMFGYVRHARLVAAQRAIEHDGLSIELAAGLAGYTSAANFATAFRRQFGAPPGRFKSRAC